MPITLDTKDFQNTLLDYLAVSGKELEAEVNKRAFSVILNTMGATKKAEMAEINKKLNTIEVIQNEEIFTSKKGKVSVKQRKNPKVTFHASRSAPTGLRIYNYRRKLRGKVGLGGKAISAPFNRFVKALSSATGYLRAGWIPARNLFAPYAKNSGGAMRTSKAISKGGEAILRAGSKGQALRGGGTVGKNIGGYIKAVFFNAIDAGSKKNTENQQILQDALNAEEIEMIGQIDKYQKRLADKYRKAFR